MRLRPLHQRVDDVLLGGNPAEMIGLRRRIGLVVEDRRMAGMRDEIGDIRPLRQVASVGRCGVEDDDDRAGSELGHQPSRDRTDVRVRHSEHHDFRPCDRRIRLDAIDAEGLFHAIASGVADLDMPDIEPRAEEVAPKPHAHLPACTE